MPFSPDRASRIREIFRGFIQRRIEKIRELRIEDLEINPFLLRVLAQQMGFSDVGPIVRWLVAQHMERGAVTSFGNALQDAAREFSEGTAVEGADILKRKGRRRFHIQVKSGPNTIPKDLGTQISRLLRSAQRRNRGSVALYGMCYGNTDQVSGIVRRYVQEEGGIDWVAGRKFWTFISDQQDCIDEIYRIAGEASENFRDESGQTLQAVLEAKTSELEEQFVAMYGRPGTGMWTRLLERNS